MLKIKLLMTKKSWHYINSFCPKVVLPCNRSRFVDVCQVKHQRNGNEIVIKCDLKNITIYKNKKLIKHETCNCN